MAGKIAGQRQIGHARRRQNLQHGLALRRANLEEERAPRLNDPAERASDGAVGVEPILAAVERDARIVAPDFRLEIFDLAARNIGRIGDDDIEISHERIVPTTDHHA